MRINILGGSNTLYYILKDHLGSASVITNDQGVEVGTQRYFPYGETRLTTGTIYTDKLFTGQREVTGLGIYHYQSRFYSPKLGRFLSADSIVPNQFNPQDLNRFSYVRNNPARYTDPTGHMIPCEPGDICRHPDPTPPPPSPDPEPDPDPTPDPNPDCVGCGGYGGQPLLAPYLNTDYYQSINLRPDYYIGSLFVPIGNPIFGVNISGIIDAYGNVYFDVGVGASVGPSLNGGGGWLLGPDNDHEHIVEDFLQGHSVNVSAGDVLGIGVNNVNPSYMQSGDGGSGIENISVEALGTSLGATLVFGWGWLIYDKGDDTPWIWQGD